MGAPPPTPTAVDRDSLCRFPKHITPVAQTFLTGLLQRLPEERFDASAIKAHPFFAGAWPRDLHAPHTPPARQPAGMASTARQRAMASAGTTLTGHAVA